MVAPLGCSSKGEQCSRCATAPCWQPSGPPTQRWLQTYLQMSRLPPWLQAPPLRPCHRQGLESALRVTGRLWTALAGQLPQRCAALRMLLAPHCLAASLHAVLHRVTDTLLCWTALLRLLGLWVSDRRQLLL